MITDIGTVFWKEWREFLSNASGGNARSRGILYMALIVMISLFIAFQTKGAWLTTPLPVLIDAIYMPLVTVLSTVADSFAGERERHTLETLLASRLTDRAILFGKLAAVASYGMVIGYVSAIGGLLVANARKASGGFQFYDPGIALSILIGAALIAVLLAGVGCLISLRAATVRQVQQAFSWTIVVTVVVLVYGTQALPKAVRANLAAFLGSLPAAQLGLLVVVVLLAVDALIISIAMARFQRARLILD